MTLLASVVRVLDEARIPHAVIGATALAAHGVARATMDLDLLVVGPAALDGAIWEPLRGQGVRVDIRRGDADDPLLGVVRVATSGQAPVDLVVGHSAWQRSAIRRAHRLEIEGTEVLLVDAADLVLLKLYAGGAQDLWDVERLLAASDRDALIREVETRLDALPADCRRLWSVVQQARPGR